MEVRNDVCCIILNVTKVSEVSFVIYAAVFILLLWLVISILVTVIALLIWSHLLNHDILDIYIVIDHWLLLRLLRQILLQILLVIWHSFYGATLTIDWSRKSILTYIECLWLLLVLLRLVGCCYGRLGQPNAIPTSV